jgi:hypothetical protein
MVKKSARLVLFVTGIFLCVQVSGGLVVMMSRPPQWPEGLRPQVWSKDQETIFQQRISFAGWYFQYDDVREALLELRFDSRADFETLWPAIVSVKSKGAPVILKKGESSYRGRPAVAGGVQILYPLSNQEGLSKPGIDPNLLAAVLKSSDRPPEYVTTAGRPFTGVLPPPAPKGYELPEPLYRVRTDIILVVDGDVIDLNRIQLPEDTPIIDQRFAPAVAPVSTAEPRP